MRPETKERADTTAGSVLRGSFTFYQATAGDVEEGGMKRGGGGGVFSLRAFLRSGADLVAPVGPSDGLWALGAVEVTARCSRSQHRSRCRRALGEE